nr:hypothetical protein cemce18_00027 [uncultured bacterium]
MMGKFEKGSRPLKKVVLQFTMECEASPFLTDYSDRYFLETLPEDNPLIAEFGYSLYSSGERLKNGVELIVVITGKGPEEVDRVGTIDASLMAERIRNFLQPDLFINAGTAGYVVGSEDEFLDDSAFPYLLIANEVCAFDRRVPGDEKWQNFARRPTSAGIIASSYLAKTLDCKVATLGSSDSFYLRKKEAAALLSSEIRHVDMEAIGVAVAIASHTPVMFIKVVGNCNGYKLQDKSAKQYESTHPKTVAKLSSGLARLIDFVAGKTLSEVSEPSSNSDLSFFAKPSSSSAFIDGRSNQYDKQTKRL